MKCTISISEEKLIEYTSRKMSKEEFAKFCQDAVVHKLWESQITSKIVGGSD